MRLVHHLSFVVLCTLLLVQRGDCFAIVAKAPPKSGGGSSGGSKTTPAPTPSAPTCRGVSGNVTDNMLYTNLCAPSCVVVVNHVADDPVVCTKWSVYASWNGRNCFARCEAVGGVQVNKTVCTARGSVLAGLYNRTGPAVALSVVPVACGTWLGVWDSSRPDSWYNSPCLSILSNRSSSTGNISACGASARTTGCRVMETKQRWVDECRLSNSTECGVEVPCLGLNPCGLGSNFAENLIGDKNGCNASSRLVVNTSVGVNSSCTGWTGHAFRYNGYCVSACDNTADACVLDGKQIQPCLNMTLGLQQRSLCYVAMPVSVETGVRNAFYGLTVNAGFGCALRVAPQNISSIQTEFIEGLWITDEFPSYALPNCNGNVTMDCIIPWPCPPPPPAAPYVYVVPEKECGFMRISLLMYESMGVHDCDWVLARDIMTVMFWALVLRFFYYFLMEKNMKLDRVKFSLTLVVLVLIFVWEFSISVFIVVYIALNIFQRWSPDLHFEFRPLDEDWT